MFYTYCGGDAMAPTCPATAYFTPVAPAAALGEKEFKNAVRQYDTGSCGEAAWERHPVKSARGRRWSRGVALRAAWSPKFA